MSKNKKMKPKFLLAALSAFIAAMAAPIAFPAAGIALIGTLSLVSLAFLYAAFQGVGKDFDASTLADLAAKVNSEVHVNEDDRSAIERVFPEFRGNPGMAPGDRHNQ